jgi:adenine-specific DNA-methyltransferase
MVQMRLSQPINPQMQIMRYMGNKRSILNFIIPILKEELSKGDPILDLFAGTCAVGYALKRGHVVFANDIQEYSYVVSSALLADTLNIRSVNHAKEELQADFYSNFEELEEVFGAPIKEESKYLGRRINRMSYSAYRAFSERYPYYSNPKGNHGYSDDFLYLFEEENIRMHRDDLGILPYMLFSTYFSNGYFGVRQCAEIDSLRYAIGQVEDLKRRTVYLTCLISALSSAVSSTGHFAQYRKINSQKSCQSILDERHKSISVAFYDKLQEFIHEYVDNGQLGRKNRCFNCDFRELFEVHSRELQDLAMVYADPPYSSANYSRFYHVLETLVKYDFPENDFVGRYRRDRQISGFCRYSSVEGEFKALFELVSGLGATLALSYSSKGMISINLIKRIASEFFGKIEPYSYSYSHSRQGRKSKIPLKEYLLMCSEPKS